MSLTNNTAIASTPMRRRLQKIARIVALLAAVSLASSPAFAGYGADTGKVLVPAEIGSFTSESGQAVARQTDGKLVIAGRCGTASGLGFCAARLNADGSLDSTFNGGLVSPAIPGKVALSLTGELLEQNHSVAIDGNGKIVLAGTCQTGAVSLVRFCAVRFNSDGSVDSTFNAGGSNGAAAGRVAFGFTSSPIQAFGGMAIQPSDNKIVFVGRCGSKQCIARLNVNGDFDSTFAPASAVEGTGRFTFKVTASSPERANAVVVDSSGKITVAGSCAADPLDLAKSVCLAKFNADGTFDTTFGAGGTGAFRIQTFTSGTFASLINEDSVALAIDGNKLLLLCKHQFNGADACIYRFNASNGSLDGSFAATQALPGKLIFQHPNIGSYEPAALAVDPSSAGRIAIVGRCADTTSMASDKICVARISNAGALDTAFTGPSGNANGGFAYDVGLGLDLGYAVNVDGGGNVYAVGDCGGKMCVLGFDAIGALNSSACAANVDADPAIRATTDGVAIIRSMLGLAGTLPAPRGLGFDVDGDGVIDASRDGLIFLRAMLGFKNASINSGISIATFANRKTWPDLRSYLNTRCGMNLPL